VGNDRDDAATVRVGGSRPDAERPEAAPEARRDDLDEARFGGAYELRGVAGAGGMGIVYEAIDRRSGTRVAVKVITGRPSLRDTQRFVSEVSALEKLDHPAIVRHVDHGETAAGEAYLAMEWLVGVSLASRLGRGPLSIVEAATFGERIADALAHAHSHGIVHRDLKPSNIFLVGDSVADARLIDFGVAKLSDRDLTTTGQMIGTPGYMAPEQVRGERGVDQRADMFAFGCVLYRAMTGRSAFEGAEVMEILARLLLHDPTPIERLLDDVPPRLAHLIGALLAKHANDRLGDAAVARDELRAIREAMATGDRRALSLRPESVPTQRPSALGLDQATVPDTPRKRRPWLWPALAVLAIAIGVVAALWMRSRSAPHCDASTRDGCAELCGRGDGEACYLWARTLHKNDFGIPIDHEGARVADDRACELGKREGCVAAASSRLSALDKDPHPNDDKRRVALAEVEAQLARACDGGLAEACRRLGKELSAGYGHLTPDPARAFTLVEKACAGNDVPACVALAAMATDRANGGTDEMRAEALRVRAEACKRKLAGLDCVAN
jgi:serine/threonine protein kinase